jgi:hypothetical protein
MKGSTKILAGTVLFVALVIVSHYVALFAMKKSGAYTSREDTGREEIPPVTGYPTNIRSVKIIGFDAVELILSDTFHYEYHRSSDTTGNWEHFNWKVAADSLIFHGDTIRYDTTKYGEIDTNYVTTSNTLTIYTTGLEKFYFENSKVEYPPALKPISLDADLFNSTLRFSSGNDDSTAWSYQINNLQARCRYSSIIFSAKWDVLKMNVELRDYSTFNDEAEIMISSQIKTGIIYYDDYSLVRLTGLNVPHLRLIRVERDKSPRKPPKESLRTRDEYYDEEVMVD